MSFLRRNRLQVAAVVVVLAGITALAVLAFRPTSGQRPAAAVTTPTARATPTPDPRVDQVKAVVRAYLQAEADSAKTGDASRVDEFVEDGSQAAGNAGENVDISREDHKNFMDSTLAIDESSWTVSMSESHAGIAVTYSLLGHEATWPGLQPLETDHVRGAFHRQFELELVGGRWLIYNST